jgi:hypothetical protein
VISFERRFANARRMTLTAPYLRQYGRDIALALRDFLPADNERCQR